MSMSVLFEELGAPLNNRMWSWGAVRESDKTVFLRVWQDGTKKYEQFGGKYYTWVAGLAGTDQSLGAAERRGHVALINDGYQVYMIMCQVENDEALTRSVKDFDDKELRLGGRLVEYMGDLLLENVGRVPVREGKVRNCVAR